MPYVQRNSKLEIVGLFANPQPGTAEEFVAEEHPEVQALRDEMGATEWPSQMPSTTEMRRMEREQQELLAEGAAMDTAIVYFLKAWSNLETSLSTLLYEALDIRPRSSRVAYAIYYSAPGFEARLRLLTEVFDQLAAEQVELASFPAIWQRICQQMRLFRDTRDLVAHGARIVLAVEGRNAVRLTSPAHDAKRAGRTDPRGLAYGGSASDIVDAANRIAILQGDTDCINRLFTHLHNRELTSFQRLLSGLQQASDA
ncbi:MAG TPA: hypothetical protein VM659_19610 [Dongiaceae bacterium]|nr:hypothetical protein [Dongiaceae bacterium]